MCDTGLIFAAADRKDIDRDSFFGLFTSLRTANLQMLLPQTVLAGAKYALEAKVDMFAAIVFVKSVEDGIFDLVSLPRVDMTRVADLVAHYDNLPPSTNDASVIALAQRFGLEERGTLDHKHSRVRRPSHVKAFRLLLEPAF